MSTNTTVIHQPSRIYLVGMMGVGKSTLGRKIAALLQYTFIDLDELIEKQEGYSISDIFELKGEDYFREKESEALHSIKEERCVISTGGGTPCYKNNMTYIIEHGIGVYLRAKTGLLYQRINHNLDKRPLLKGMNEEEIKGFLEKKLLEREPFYQQAQYIFDVPIASVGSIVKSILSAD